MERILSPVRILNYLLFFGEENKKTCIVKTVSPVPRIVCVTYNFRPNEGLVS
jgi:hypothetical protein